MLELNKIYFEDCLVGMRKIDDESIDIKIQTENKRKEYLTGILKDGITLSDVWNDIPALSHNSKEKLNHPTQKPLKLIERIIQLGSNETNIVLDNCAGSGTTLLAAKNLKRNFIGFENNEEYFKIIQKRLE
jgi:site-specific DNA-methyltransferase (adenine-specific)